MVGYCTLFPIKNLPIPSLYSAAKGGQSGQASGWDEDVEKLWRWKDEFGKQGRAYYAKYFRGRGTFISCEYLPYFMVIEQSPTQPREHDRFYSLGRVSQGAHIIWNTLSSLGPLATLELRHACKMNSPQNNARFKRALLELQRLLAIVHFGTDQEAGSWASSRFELTCRAFPDLTKKVHDISPKAAKAAIVSKYLEHYPEAVPMQLHRLFGWPAGDIKETLGSAIATYRRTKG